MILYTVIESFNNKFKDSSCIYIDKTFEYIDTNINEILSIVFDQNSEYYSKIIKKYKSKIAVAIHVFTDSDGKVVDFPPFPKSREDYLNNYLTHRVYVYDTINTPIKRFENISYIVNPEENIGTYIRFEDDDFNTPYRYQLGDLVLLDDSGYLQLCKVIDTGLSAVPKGYYYIPNVYSLELIKILKRTKSINNTLYHRYQLDNHWHYTDILGKYEEG